MISGGLLTGASLALGAIGTGVQVRGQQIASAASDRLEKLREKQMNLESARMRRQTVREAIMARSTALSNATAQGAEGGSGLQGGYGQISGQMNRNIQGINQSQEIGTQMFRENAAVARGQSMSNMGSSISGFGGMVANNAQQLTRLGRYYSGYNNL